ncbi:MAG TPA: M20 family metallopeptidase [Flavobacteriales bacterium]|nr:M20 family metallopeptidase [Flavobacteriales bacterium]
MSAKKQIQDLSKEFLPKIIDIRRNLHSNPELSFQEFETSKYIKSILADWGIPFQEHIADTGIVVLLKGKNSEKSCTALRADFDALPIQEENEVAYCSKNNGVMHACGHDAHTASLLGALKILHTLKSDWEGSIKFIFQPAEERLPGGAKQMISEGVLENPKVDNMLGQHVFPDLEVGKVGFKAGMYMASTDELYITILGKGGHAALPEETKNPIIVASTMLTALYDYFDNENDGPSVFSIGFIEGNGSTNVVPDKVKMMGTLRAMDEDWRVNAHKKMIEISSNLGKKNNVEIDFEIRKGYPFLENDIPLTKKAIECAKQYLGEENVALLPIRMTAEDFSYYSQKVPSCFYRLGTANKEKGITHGLHTSRFNIDENALEIGMGLMAFFATEDFN